MRPRCPRFTPELHDRLFWSFFFSFLGPELFFVSPVSLILFVSSCARQFLYPSTDFGFPDQGILSLCLSLLRGLQDIPALSPALFPLPFNFLSVDCVLVQFPLQIANFF